MKHTFKLDLKRCLTCGARVYRENFVSIDKSLLIATPLRAVGIIASAPAERATAQLGTRLR